MNPMKISMKPILFFLLSLVGLVGCASQEAIPEVTERSKPDCALGALVDGNPSGRELGSCGSTLEQLDDTAAKKRK